MRFSARMLTIIFSVFLFLLPITYSLLPTPAYAQTQITNSIDANVSPTISTLAQGVLWGMLSFTSCLVSGKDVASQSGKCLAYNPQSGKLGYAPDSQGLLGLATSGIAYLYSPPDFHVGSYVSYVTHSFSPVKIADAASPGPSGFDQLSPIMKLWIAFRNITYLLFVIIFVIIGFAIMLRAKIDPRTVMTIENQIPKIIIALLLITFSYAIAGFVIDIMWLVTYVTINLFASLDPVLSAAKLTQNINANPLTFLDQTSAPGIIGGGTFGSGVLGLILQPANSIYQILVPIIKEVLSSAGWLALPGIIPCFLENLGNFPSAAFHAISSTLGPVGTFINAATGQTAANTFDLNQCVQNGFISWGAGIAGVAAFLIFAFALLFALLRMYFALLKSYALFLIYAILGPFFIMLGVLPESKITFDNWIRHLLAYSLVFPYAIGIILLGKTLSDVYSGTNVGYIPPLIGVTQGTFSPIGPLVGFAIILLLPQALTMLQDSLKAPDMKYLPGLGQMLAQGSQAYTSIVNQPWKRLTRPYDQLRGLSEGPIRKALMNIPTPFGKIRKLAGENEPPITKSAK